MTLKIKCTYVAEGEPFTLGRKYDIYCADGGMFYIKNDYGRKIGEFKDGYATPIAGVLEALNEGYHSHFTTCVTLEPDPEQEIHELLSKATTLIYENQDLCNIKLDDFITLVKLTEDTK